MDALVDWSPVVAVVELLDVWLPVVDVVELESDWSPVDVVLSMLSVERPRRSIDGLKTDEEPDIVLSLVDEEPVTDELVLAADPVVEGLVVVEDVVGAFMDEAPEPDGIALEEPTLAEELVDDASAAESGMQSAWTGLAECSAARPVSLPASLPALLLLRVLQSGFDAVGVVPTLDALFAAVDLEAGFSARAGVDSSAATARTLRNRERIMVHLLRLS